MKYQFKWNHHSIELNLNAKQIVPIEPKAPRMSLSLV